MHLHKSTAMKILLHERGGKVTEKELAGTGFPAIIILDDCQKNRGFQRVAIDNGVGEYAECETVTVMP